MVVETEVLPLLQWLLLSGRSWLMVVVAVLFVGLSFGWLVAALRHGPLVALRLVGRTFVEGVVDLVRISPRRVGSLARLAVKESIRRRLVVVVVFAVFVLVLLFAGWFLDRSSSHPSELYISFVLGATSYLTVLLALFLSALSLPADIKEKTLHTVVTKPVRPSEIVLGRIVGFSVIGTILLAIMGAISYGFVVRGLDHSHDLPAAELEAVEKAYDAAIESGESRTRLKLTTGKTHGHRHEVAVSVDVDSPGSPAAGNSAAGNSAATFEKTGRVRTGTTQDHRHEFSYAISTKTTSDASEDRRGTKIECSLGGPQGRLIARVPVYGKLRFKDRTGGDARKGINVGDEWTYRSFIAGGTPAAAVWTFDGVTEERFPNGLPLDMTIEVFRTFKGDTSDETTIPGIPGSLSVRNPETGAKVDDVRIFTARDFTIDAQTIPRKLTTTDGRKLDLFDDLVADGKVEIWLQCLSSGQYYGAAQPDMYLRARNASFALNFAKGYIGIWIQMVMVIGIGVMFSTFLSAPIALLATLGTLVVGLFEIVHQFMARLAAGEALGGGPVEATIRILSGQNLVTDMEPGLRTTAAQMIDGVLQYPMKVTTAVIPRFDQFGLANYVAHGFDITGVLLLESVCYAMAFVVPLFVAGYIFLKLREVAR